MTRLELMGFPLDVVTLESTISRLQEWIRLEVIPHTVITLNPEIVIQAQEQPDLADTIGLADLITADGVGIIWAAKTLLGVHLPERVTGVDITTKLLEREGRNLRVYYLGGKPGIAESAAQRMLGQFGTIAVGSHHGYFKDDGFEDLEVAQAIRDSRPHVLLTALGAGRQERFNQCYKTLMEVPVCIGVGGTLDVLSGVVERAPDWTAKLGMEWAWRVAGDRKRWGRAPRLALFVRKVLQAKQNNRRKT
jgi:N-acetylglucosaminyldiphosphoundecaprenol N-acetyl-beta-D-mannosaminyltransferase